MNAVRWSSFSFKEGNSSKINKETASHSNTSSRFKKLYLVELFESLFKFESLQFGDIFSGGHFASLIHNESFGFLMTSILKRFFFHWKQLNTTSSKTAGKASYAGETRETFFRTYQQGKNSIELIFSVRDERNFLNASSLSGFSSSLLTYLLYVRCICKCVCLTCFLIHV